MKIITHSINNRTNEEPKAYDEKKLITGEVRLSDNFASAALSHKLIIKQDAVREMFNFIEWRIGVRSDLRVEQGGIMLGKRYCDTDNGIHFAVVSKVITADSAIGSLGHIDFTQECWREMHSKKDDYNRQTGENAKIVGWFHTHPNTLSCFMSSTDQHTQDLYFDGDNTYSVVINPQRHLLKVFRSKACYPAQAFLVWEQQQKKKIEQMSIQAKYNEFHNLYANRHIDDYDIFVRSRVVEFFLNNPITTADSLVGLVTHSLVKEGLVKDATPKKGRKIGW